MRVQKRSIFEEFRSVELHIKDFWNKSIFLVPLSLLPTTRLASRASSHALGRCCELQPPAPMEMAVAVTAAEEHSWDGFAASLERHSSPRPGVCRWAAPPFGSTSILPSAVQLRAKALPGSAAQPSCKKQTCFFLSATVTVQHRLGNIQVAPLGPFPNWQSSPLRRYLPAALTHLIGI